MGSVLVVNATKHGSSREAAEAIGTAMRARGSDAHVHPSADVRDPIGGWDLVVLGAPIYSGRWHRDAHRFLKRHRAELVHMPVAVYGMGPREDDPEAWQRARGQLDRALAKRDWDAIRWATAVADLGGAADT